MKFRKKPIVIEAMQVPRLDDPASQWNALHDWLGWGGQWQKNTKFGIDLATLEGTMTANQGDWIIRGVKGEIYPCKPDIFEATYEPAGDTTPSPET